jgi:hypothetical protein
MCGFCGAWAMAAWGRVARAVPTANANKDFFI